MTLDKRTVAEAEGFARIDFHTHILPALDHGSDDVFQSQKQIARLYSAGVTTVCATSHFYPNEKTVTDFLSAREEALDMLISSVDGQRPEIILGAETLICEGLERMEGLEGLCIEGTRTLLLELPLWAKSIGDGMYETVFAIRDKGIIPVLAHVDRYPREVIEPLKKEGIYAQINAVGISGVLKPRHIMDWIDDGFVVAIGSDYHYLTDKGVEAYEKLCSKRPDIMSRLFQRSGELLTNAIKR